MRGILASYVPFLCPREIMRSFCVMMLPSSRGNPIEARRTSPGGLYVCPYVFWFCGE